jgi:hypothetical protein
LRPVSEDAANIFNKRNRTPLIRGVARVISAVHYHGNGLLLRQHQLFLSAAFFFGFSVWQQTWMSFLAPALHRFLLVDKLESGRFTLIPVTTSCRPENDPMLCVFLFISVPRIVSLSARMSFDNAQTRNPTVTATNSSRSKCNFIGNRLTSRQSNMVVQLSFWRTAMAPSLDSSIFFSIFAKNAISNVPRRRRWSPKIPNAFRRWNFF